MKYLRISNKGLMDALSLTLLGASSKREDHTKIGMFGSGNKYALAFFLRNNYDLEIYSGTEKIAIGTVEKKHRDNSFKVITVNGTETSITTEFGKDWEFWQALREVYCNAIDEGGHRLDYVMDIEPKADETHFYIRTRSEITNFVQKFDNYFAENKKALFECEDGKILEKSPNSKFNLFRKGIRCFESDKNSIFDYDLKDISIDENRLVKYSWTVPSHVWNIIYQCTNKDVIKEILFRCGNYDVVECLSSDFASLNADLMSAEFKEVVKELQFAPKGMSGLLNNDEVGKTTVVPNTVFEQILPHVNNDNLANKFQVYKEHFFMEIPMTALHEATLKEARKFFEECNYTGPLDYPVKIARFEKKGVLGMADRENKTILISENGMAKGVQTVIEIMIEEFIHLKYNADDETRSFQDAAITELVNLLKIKNAYLL